MKSKLIFYLSFLISLVAILIYACSISPGLDLYYFILGARDLELNRIGANHIYKYSPGHIYFWKIIGPWKYSEPILVIKLITFLISLILTIVSTTFLYILSKNILIIPITISGIYLILIDFEGQTQTAELLILIFFNTALLITIFNQYISNNLISCYRAICFAIMLSIKQQALLTYIGYILIALFFRKELKNNIKSIISEALLTILTYIFIILLLIPDYASFVRFINYPISYKDICIDNLLCLPDNLINYVWLLLPVTLLIGVNYTIKNKVFINFLLFSAAASLYQFTVRDYKHYALITLVPLFLMYLIIIFDSKHKLKFIIITNILIILNLSYFSLFNIQSTSSSILGFRESNKKELNSLCDKLDKSKSLLSFPTKFFEMHIVCSTFFLVDGSVDKQLDDNQVGNLYELITSKKFEQLIIYNRDDIPSWIIDNDELCKPLNCYTLFNSIDIYGYKVRLSNENKYTIWEKIN